MLKFRQFYFVLILLSGVFLGSINTRSASATGGNGITFPPNGATVRGVITIEGYADDPTFQKWQLDVLVGGDEQRVVPVTRSVLRNSTGGPFGKLDTRLLPDGTHRLRLRVVRKDGNYDEYFTTFSINNKITPTATASFARIANTPRPANTIAAVPRVVTRVVQVVRPTRTAAPTRTVAPTRTPRPPARTSTPVPLTLYRITVPQNGSSLSGTVSVKGLADDPNFQAWQLDLLFGTDPRNAVPVARSNVRHSIELPFMQLDTTALPNGLHQLRLRVIKNDGMYNEYISSIDVENPIQKSEIYPLTCPTLLKNPSGFGGAFLMRVLNFLSSLFARVCGIYGQ